MSVASRADLFLFGDLTLHISSGNLILLPSDFSEPAPGTSGRRLSPVQECNPRRTYYYGKCAKKKGTGKSNKYNMADEYKNSSPNCKIGNKC